MPDLIISEITTDWSDYIERGLEPKKINTMIFNSWKRCKDYGVDPYGGCGAKVNEAILAESMEKNKDLIEISKPIMDNLHSIVQGTGFLLVLTDCTGLILHLIGEIGRAHV